MKRQSLYDSGRYIFLAFFSFTLAFYLTIGYLFFTVNDACSGIDCFKINEHAWEIIYATFGLSLLLYVCLRMLLSTVWGTWVVKSLFWLAIFSVTIVGLVIVL